MPKLPQVSTRELIKFLNHNGWVLDHVKGDHYILKNAEGRYVSIPLRNPIGKGLLLAILAEVGISREEFMKEWWG